MGAVYYLNIVLLIQLMRPVNRETSDCEGEVLEDVTEMFWKVFPLIVEVETVPTVN